MTKLELVNAVLVLMRLDPVTTTVGVDDEAVRVVIEHVNAAKVRVENAWRWNANRVVFEIPILVDVKTYALSGTYEQLTFEEAVSEKSYELKQTNPRSIRKKPTAVGNNVLEWAVNGQNTDGEVLVDFWPTPKATDTVRIYGWVNSPRLESDDDVLVIPSQPVIYEALALSLRERGEVGGQTALEAFGMAKRYLEDAIALDQGMNQLDTTWVTV